MVNTNIQGIAELSDIISIILSNKIILSFIIGILICGFIFLRVKDRDWETIYTNP